jgi:hypothetical protein
VRPHETIVCPDCGSTCGLIQAVGPEDDFEPGDIVAYRCPDCLDRWDVVISDEDTDENEGGY